MTLDQAQRRKSLARWHRRLALLVGLWLALLALSGILINHAHDWGLDRTPLPRSILAGVYGIDADSPDFCALLPSIGPACSEVFGQLQLPAGQLLLGASQVILLDENGTLIETLAAGQLGLIRLEGGLSQGDDVYLRDGEQTVRTDANLLEFKALDATDAGALVGAPWQTRSGPADTVTWERLLLDLHAARFLGPAARWFNDLMAGLILVLAASGAWLYSAKRRRD